MRGPGREARAGDAETSVMAETRRGDGGTAQMTNVASLQRSARRKDANCLRT